MLNLFFLILVVIFFNIVILREWTNLYNRWCVMTSYWKIILKPFGFCIECTCGQVSFWYLLINGKSIIETLGITAGVILTIKLINYAKDRIEER